MKKALVTLTAVASSGAASAHGFHDATANEAAHGFVHALPLLAIVVLAVAAYFWKKE